MAKNTPIITQTEILAMAGRHIQQTILDLRAQAESLKYCVSTEEEKQAMANIIASTEQQVICHMERLQAVETMYHIETGSELGLIVEL
ncbi:MAG: hypothetical protein IJ030_02655 [Oscillospiraceae bacterium]|nr:hypothetical protein [Oscillospiraceae bacterium]